jgi:replicative DNA helicase
MSTAAPSLPRPARATQLPHDVGRTLPHSVEAEQGVLGSMLISPREIIGECVEKIGAEYFYVPAHQTIYNVLVELWNAGSGIDLITFTQILRDRKILDAVGGAAFVTSLFTFVPTAANVTYYLEIVREKFVLRQIIAACTESVRRAFEEQGEVAALLDEVEQKIFAVGQDRFNASAQTMQEHVMEAIESIERLWERRGGITGLASGFSEFDKMTDGLHAAEMIVIAARPSMGKTALAMNIAEHVALDGKLPVAVFSLEMSASQLVQRMLCSRARVNLAKVRDGFLAERDFPAMTSAAEKLGQAKIFIDDTASISILELRAKARRLKAQHDVALIVIDYLQLLRSTTRRASDNRQLEISEISSGIKGLAKELKIPIIVPRAADRNPENRTGESKGRPRLSDLRESGSIEQDADLVALLVREEYYADTDEARDEAAGKADLIIAKQRNGPVGEIPLTFLKEFTRFEDRAQGPNYESFDRRHHVVAAVGELGALGLEDNRDSNAQPVRETGRPAHRHSRR